MTNQRKTTGRALFCAAVFGLCVAALLSLLACWTIYSQDAPHLDHGCYTVEEFLGGLLFHERLLFRLNGHEAVWWGYTLAACSVVALGLFVGRLALRPRPTSQSGPSTRLTEQR